MPVTKPLTVSLHTEKFMTDTIKYRGAWSAPSTLGTTAVSNGNFANKNLFCDNTVDLGMDSLIPGYSATYNVATQANYIKIVSEGFTVVGQITDWEYVNDTNVKISYKVDAFTSAIASGFIENMSGICDRVHMDYTDNHVNLQAEPFSPSDVSYANATITKNLNDFVKSFENINTNGSLSGSGYVFVLTVSPAVIEFLGASAWAMGAFMPTPTLKNVTTLNFYGNDVTEHMGGIMRGTPLVYANLSTLQMEVKNLLKGCGFRCTMPSAGYGTQQSVNNRTMMITADNGGQLVYSHKNWNNDAYECLRYITGNDFYNVYCIPQEFAKNDTASPHSEQVISGFRSISGGTQPDKGLHEICEEEDDKGRLTAYPYCYTRLVTANNDTIDIIPQNFHQHENTFTELPQIQMTLRFIGGDSPRLMAAIAPNRAQEFDPYENSSVYEWFTVRSYPSVTMSFSDTFNQQSQRDLENTKKLIAAHATITGDRELQSSFKQHYLDGVKGGTVNENLGWWDYAKAGAGSWMGYGAGLLSEAVGKDIATQPFTDEASQAMSNAAWSVNAGNFITPGSIAVMGNDFYTQLVTPAFAAYRCGATDAELYAYCRYLDEYGHAANFMLNPLTDDYAQDSKLTLFNGKATVKRVPKMGKQVTYYRFGNITIFGFMPNEWRQSIKALFENGVYLMD